MTITFKEIEAQVRTLASQNSTFVYDAGRDELGGDLDARYLPDEHQDGCIFGQAILTLTSNLNEALATYDTIGDVLRDSGIDATDNQYSWAILVQQRQDNGTAWGEAVNRADKEIFWTL